MRRTRLWLALLMAWSLASVTQAEAPAENSFLLNLSKVVTRAARKELLEKSFPFSQGPFVGTIKAVEPEKHLRAELREFGLINDTVSTTVAGSGRFQIDGKINGQTDIRALFDVKLEIAAGAQFGHEGEQYYVEPKVNDLNLQLTMVEASPAELSGVQDLLTGLLTTGFRQNKDKIIAEINKRIGKRPL